MAVPKLNSVTVTELKKSVGRDVKGIGTNVEDGEATVADTGTAL